MTLYSADRPSSAVKSPISLPSIVTTKRNWVPGSATLLVLSVTVCEQAGSLSVDQQLGAEPGPDVVVEAVGELLELVVGCFGEARALCRPGVRRVGQHALDPRRGRRRGARGERRSHGRRRGQPGILGRWCELQRRPRCRRGERALQV